MPLSPYLSFAGNCADAIAYYQRTLGAELLYKISFGEMPKSAQDSAENCPSGMQFPDTAIAHANVRIAGMRYHDERCYTVRKSQLLRLYAGARFATGRRRKTLV